MPLDGSGWRPTEPRDDLARVLDRAADLVEQGWCQGKLARHWLGWSCSPYDALATRVCARGAILRALWQTGENDPYAREMAVVEEVIVVAYKTTVGARLMMTREWEYALQTGHPSSLATDLAAIERWNDIHGMTAGEIAHLFRLTAGELRRGA